MQGEIDEALGRTAGTGAGSRYHAMNLAMEYYLTGWVRNL